VAAVTGLEVAAGIAPVGVASLPLPVEFVPADADYGFGVPLVRVVLFSL
jgi:hypothetical protein